MFRSKRSALVKRLWRTHLLQNETLSQNETTASGKAVSPPNSPQPGGDTETKSVAQSMLKRLKERQLETLVQSVESKGGETTGCVLLPQGDMRIGKRTIAPHVLCCQLWRWPEITSSTELKRLPCCGSAEDPLYICCNPYHWSVQQKSDSPFSCENWSEIPNLKFTELDHLNLNESLMDTVSTETGNTPTLRRLDYSDDSMSLEGSQSQHWCTIAYWELRQRVGRLFTVESPSINVFKSLPHGDGLSLDALQTTTDLDAVKRTREKIGFGIMLFRQEGEVWLYNRSNFPVFVNSSLFDSPNTRTPVVCKVTPGRSIKIFDYNFIEFLKGIRDSRFLDGPYDPRSIRISFAKGWGPTYHRQFITSCPCWLELLLNVNR